MRNKEAAAAWLRFRGEDAAAGFRIVDKPVFFKSIEWKKSGGCKIGQKDPSHSTTELLSPEKGFDFKIWGLDPPHPNPPKSFRCDVTEMNSRLTVTLFLVTTLPCGDTDLPLSPEDTLSAGGATLPVTHEGVFVFFCKKKKQDKKKQTKQQQEGTTR